MKLGHCKMNDVAIFHRVATGKDTVYTIICIYYVFFCCRQHFLIYFFLILPLHNSYSLKSWSFLLLHVVSSSILRNTFPYILFMRVKPWKRASERLWDFHPWRFSKPIRMMPLATRSHFEVSLALSKKLNLGGLKRPSSRSFSVFLQLQKLFFF